MRHLAGQDVPCHVDPKPPAMDEVQGCELDMAAGGERLVVHGQAGSGAMRCNAMRRGRQDPVISDAVISLCASECCCSVMGSRR